MCGRTFKAATCCSARWRRVCQADAAVRGRADRAAIRVPSVRYPPHGREIKRLIDANPFVRNVAAADALYVAFLSSKRMAVQIASLDANRSPGDSFIVVGREIFMNLAANGAARTKLTTAYFDAKLDTVSTVRNWGTTLTILEMMDPAR